MPIWLALLLGSGVSAIGQIFEANKAADTQSTAANDAIKAQLGMFGITRESLEPFISGGASSMDLLTGKDGTPMIPAHWKTAGTPAQWKNPQGQVVSKPFGFKPPAGQSGWVQKSAGVAGQDVTRPAGWTPAPAVQAQWKNPQGQTVSMPPGWKPGAGQKGWVLQVPGKPAGHALSSQWIGPNGQVQYKPWNWKPPAGQAASWSLKKAGQAPSTGMTQVSPGQAATKAQPGLLETEFLKPIEMDQATLEKTPGYQWALAQGEKSTQNALTARGLGGVGSSGASIKGAEDYAVGLASQTYQQQFANALANKNMAWSALYGTGQLGENAAQGVSTAAINAGGQIGGNITAAGGAQAKSDIATANAITGVTNALSTQAMLNNSKNSTGVDLNQKLNFSGT
jgi:hypothetical protein